MPAASNNESAAVVVQLCNVVSDVIHVNHLCSAKRHHWQEHSAPSHQDASNFLNESLFSLVSRQVPGHSICCFHHHCTAGRHCI